MKVVRHDAVGEQAKWNFFEAENQASQERLIVCVAFKKPQAPCAAVHDVKYMVATEESSGHDSRQSRCLPSAAKYVG
jgi:hypothetical protein